MNPPSVKLSALGETINLDFMPRMMDFSSDLSNPSEDGRCSEEPSANTNTLLSINNGTGKRKGHRKSRAGCFGCKRKKIKCQETRPSCKNCVRSGIICRYPSNPDATASSALSLNPTSSFSLDDLRYFHHFLTMAYPHLPLGRSEAWIRDIPALAHHYDFLMYSILSLGSCHLDYISPTRKGQGWERHRLLAIKGLNDAFSRDPRQGPERDAMLATCYALTFESAYRGDSLAEFLTLVRGCGTMTIQLKTSNHESVLVPTNSRSHLEIMVERLQNTTLPTIRPNHVNDALASLIAVRPLCLDKVSLDLVESMIKTVSLCQTSSRDAYFSCIRIYDKLTSMNPEDFAILTDTSNSVGQILQGHFVAVEAMLSPFLSREYGREGPHVPGRLSEKVVRLAYDSCVSFAQEYLTWPLEFCDSVAMTFPNTEAFLCVPEEDEFTQGTIEEIQFPTKEDSYAWQLSPSRDSSYYVGSP